MFVWKSSELLISIHKSFYAEQEKIIPDLSWNALNPCPAEPGYTLALQTV